MKTSNFKKGDVVWMIGDWDRDGSSFVVKGVIGSWGKKQGYLINAQGEKSMKFQLDTVKPPLLRLVSELENPESLALEYSLACQNVLIMNNQWNVLHHHLKAFTGNYPEIMKKDTQKLIDTAPTFVILDTYGCR